MNMIPIAGALFGAMMGLFAAKEFTDRALLQYAGSCMGACLGIILGVLIASRFRAKQPPPDES